ncbi:OmpA/MotB domain protein [Alkaliphilus metalliredigens QYMF]|uniref:OmpA/MotB domain protein n=1 Tax=Alkaliphilus metalliredigens (strain QYMF) TaxID=293826 RepID=A6TK11_ALKMQ|nr:OmpA family protein [Alkaliphilus metalliredigens]ABR46529.1 OmpA/MotB domain protein [Alkaliphilus metalliredigens QYMF]
MKAMSSKYDGKKYETEYSNSWLITYSDMITIVLCFFIIFFTFTAEEASVLYHVKEALTSEVADLSDENQRLLEEKESLAALLFGLEDIELDLVQSQETFIRFLRENHLLDRVDVIEEERGLVIRFRDSVLFGSGQARISQEGYMLLDHVTAKLRTIDNAIVIEGFTDNIPIQTNEFPSNWELSVARAIGVARYMIDEEYIEESRISVSGFGEQQPIDSNETNEGRANNRRIEITILH